MRQNQRPLLFMSKTLQLPLGLLVCKIIPVPIVLKWSPENGKAIEVENEKVLTKSYMRSGPTILRLLEKTRAWSGEDDSTIKVLVCYSQQGRLRTTSILVRAFWNFKCKFLKYSRTCSLFYLFIIIFCWFIYTHLQLDIFSTYYIKVIHITLSQTITVKFRVSNEWGVGEDSKEEGNISYPVLL